MLIELHLSSSKTLACSIYSKLRGSLHLCFRNEIYCPLFCNSSNSKPRTVLQNEQQQRASIALHITYKLWFLYCFTSSWYSTSFFFWDSSIPQLVSTISFHSTISSHLFGGIWKGLYVWHSVVGSLWSGNFNCSTKSILTYHQCEAMKNRHKRWSFCELGFSPAPIKVMPLLVGR